ncbi:MAG: hypothetical protein ABEJ24_02405 [Candidatus Magasanikbacteria bacterium]
MTDEAIEELEEFLNKLSEAQDEELGDEDISKKEALLLKKFLEDNTEERQQQTVYPDSDTDQLMQMIYPWQMQ